MTTFHLPDLGEGLQDAELLSWHVSQGDHVTVDQPLVSVETDKAVVEIPAPASGQIVELFAKPGDIVPVGAPLLEYGDGSGEDPGAIVGDLETESRPSVFDQDRSLRQDPAVTRARSDRLSAAPAVRHLAQDLNVDLAVITPTGQHGEITSTDVRRASTLKTARIHGPAGRVEPMRGVRRAMAIRMEHAGRTIVPATLHDRANISDWPNKNALLTSAVRSLVAAAKVEPALNAWFEWDGQQRTLFDVVNVGLAVDTPDGLIVPVLKDAGSIPEASLQNELNRLISRAHDRSLRSDELQGATITLSNFGAVAGRYANLVVVPPQVAILGIGRADGADLPLSLTIDHRAVSGGEAARFLAAFINVLECQPMEQRNG